MSTYYLSASLYFDAGSDNQVIRKVSEDFNNWMVKMGRCFVSQKLIKRMERSKHMKARGARASAKKSWLSHACTVLTTRVQLRLLLCLLQAVLHQTLHLLTQRKHIVDGLHFVRRWLLEGNKSRAHSGKLLLVHGHWCVLHGARRYSWHQTVVVVYWMRVIVRIIEGVIISIVWMILVMQILILLIVLHILQLLRLSHLRLQ